MDRRLPRDEDGLAPDRRLTMAVGTGGGASASDGPATTGARTAASSGASSSTRRRATSGRPSTIRPRPRRSSRSSGSGRRRRPGRPRPRPARRTHRLGLLRDAARVESLEARPDSRFRLRVTGSGFDSEWSWRLEPVAGGTRVIHAATFEPFDRWTGILVRLGGSSGQPGRGAPARAQGAGRGGRRRPAPRPSVSAEATHTRAAAECDDGCSGSHDCES